MSQFATTAELRSYLDTQQNTGRFSDTNLTFLLQTASNFLERRTGRRITSTGSNATYTASTNGEAFVPIPDFRSISSVTLQGVTLDADTTYWPVASRQSQDIITGIQVRPFRRGMGSRWYLGNPEWFDRNLDSPLYPGGPWGRYSTPNDLIVVGLDGWFSTPPEWKMAAMVLAGYYLEHRNSLLTGIALTPEGNVLDYTNYPPEVRDLIESWRIGQEAVLTG
jgi:hypothetical protein